MEINFRREFILRLYKRSFDIDVNQGALKNLTDQNLNRSEITEWTYKFNHFKDPNCVM